MFGPKVKTNGWRDASLIYDNPNAEGPMVVDDEEADI